MFTGSWLEPPFSTLRSPGDWHGSVQWVSNSSSLPQVPVDPTGLQDILTVVIVPKIPKARIFHCGKNQLKHWVKESATKGLAQIDKWRDVKTHAKEKNYWPDDYDILYGETEVRTLCKRFQIPEVEVLDGFREYKDNRGKRVPKKNEPTLYHSTNNRNLNCRM